MLGFFGSIFKDRNNCDKEKKIRSLLAIFQCIFRYLLGNLNYLFIFYYYLTLNVFMVNHIIGRKINIYIKTQFTFSLKMYNVESNSFLFSIFTQSYVSFCILSRYTHFLKWTPVYFLIINLFQKTFPPFFCVYTYVYVRRLNRTKNINNSKK